MEPAKIDSSSVIKKAGRPRQPNKMTVTFRLEKKLLKAIQQKATDKGVGRSVVVSMALKSFINEEEKKTAFLRKMRSAIDDMIADYKGQDGKAITIDELNSRYGL